MRTSVHFADDNTASIRLTFDSKQEKAIFEMAVQNRTCTDINWNEDYIAFQLTPLGLQESVPPNAGDTTKSPWMRGLK